MNYTVHYSTPFDIPKEFQVPFAITFPFCILSFVGSILNLIWGCVVANGGLGHTSASTNEIHPLGLALISLSGFFFICFCMFLTFLISMSRKYDCNRPWFYCFSIAVLPLIFAAYNFILQIGTKRKVEILFSGLASFGCFLGFIALMGYIYFISSLDLTKKEEPSVETAHYIKNEKGQVGSVRFGIFD